MQVKIDAWQAQIYSHCNQSYSRRSIAAINLVALRFIYGCRAVYTAMYCSNFQIRTTGKSDIWAGGS